MALADHIRPCHDFCWCYFLQQIKVLEGVLMITTRKFVRFALLATTTLALGACTADNNPFQNVQLPAWMQAKKATSDSGVNRNLISPATSDCPRVSALPELSRVTQFADESNPVSETVLSNTVLTKLDSSCITTESAINLDIVLNFTSSLGTAGLSQNSAQSSYSHAYFLAVVDPQGQIIAKDVFALSPVFQSGQKEVFSTERLQQTIPLSSKTPANQYQVMVGFQLSEAELAHNRSIQPRSVETMPATPAADPQARAAAIPRMEPTRPRSSINQ